MYLTFQVKEKYTGEKGSILKKKEKKKFATGFKFVYVYVKYTLIGKMYSLN